jgi:hypothetical protein
MASSSALYTMKNLPALTSPAYPVLALYQATCTYLVSALSARFQLLALAKNLQKI